ncbi:hypothetical protein PR202_ga22238 [Eleusine coracana subsp. coracana]|uniref:Uncharacterized protein n=1 Tax=Eleusine coracana subsp. coracana TaxID=191504 RepID=A0AAV5D3I7_ELECO|nr:hypothetical protein PR202_ga22238 [Eleusine coracana subsp. coracana]
MDDRRVVHLRVEPENGPSAQAEAVVAERPPAQAEAVMAERPPAQAEVVVAERPPAPLALPSECSCVGTLHGRSGLSLGGEEGGGQGRIGRGGPVSEYRPTHGRSRGGCGQQRWGHA